MLPLQVPRDKPLPKPVIVCYDPSVYRNIETIAAYIVTDSAEPNYLIQQPFKSEFRRFIEDSWKVVWRCKDIQLNLPVSKHFKIRVCLFNARQEVIGTKDSETIEVIEHGKRGDYKHKGKERALHATLKSRGAFRY
ncbi:hypothetical protein HD806DRAFT_478022 [Xylariaceae sp. AK1471]|nr:hypothetical protein HD806DRAFT_478022 [Xylariaceae sp. AK1471]